MLSKPFFPRLAAFAVTLAVGVAGEYGLRLEQQRIAQDQRNRAMSAIGQYRAMLESELNATLYLTNGLIAYVATHSTLEPKVVNPMLQTLYDQGRHLRNIGLAPGNHLTYVYPVEGNEKAIGLYYPDLPEQWPAVERAIRERQPRLAGPVRLKQGGIGFIYRVPVFIGPAGEYWGLLSTVIDQERLFAKAGIAPEVDGLQLALRGKDGAGAEGETFMGDAALFATDALKATINTPGGSWLIAVRPIGGWTAGERLGWLRAGTWGLGILFGFLVYYALAIAATKAAALRQLAEGEEKLRGLYEMSPLGIVMTDMKGRFIEFNEAFRCICGYPADELKALDYWTLTPKGYEADERLQLDSLKRTGHYGPYEKDCIRKDGTPVPLRANGMLITGTDGQQYIWSIVEDVTDRKQTEAELIASKQSAEKASLTKSRFLAAASHDLRQPVQAINLFCDGLNKTGLSKEQKRISDYLSLSVRNLGDILNALLDISKLEAGMVKPNPVVIQSDALFRHIDSEFAHQAAAKSLRLKLYFPHREMAILVDAKLLQSLLGNLIGNAIKYTERGGVLVGIRRRGNRAVIQVWDTGIGIAPEHVNTIFDEYFQIGNPERDRAKGLGLGLSIARHLAELLETEVVCRSRPGKGSVFEFSLPLADILLKEELRHIEPAKSGTGAVSGLTSRNIVLIEDNPIVAEATRLALESIGIRVTAYGSAQDALASSDIADADFYISDLSLPGLNGIELLDAIQQRSPQPIKAVVLTGNTSPSLVATTQSSRWQLLFKPVNLPMLLAAIAAQETMR